MAGQQYTTAQIQQMIVAEANAQGVNPALALSVAQQESSFNPNAVSGAGAQGLFQLMPAAQKDVGVTDPFDVTQNIEGGIAYLKKMLNSTGGDITDALQAYNGGLAHVENNTVSSAAVLYSNQVQNRIPGMQQLMAALGLSTPETTAPPVAPSTTLPADLTTPPDDTTMAATFIPVGSVDLSQVPTVVWLTVGGFAAWKIFDAIFGGR